MQPTIYIIGVGAIGMTLAVLLKQSGKEVVLIRGRRNGQPETEEAQITLFYTDELSLKATVPIRTLDQISELNGFILLTTKSFIIVHLSSCCSPF